MQADPQFRQNRRAFLTSSTGALGALALHTLLAESGAAAGSAAAPHHPAAADSVICLFQHGGPSQVDLFDPKPELTRRDGQPYDGELEIHFVVQRGNCLASPFRFAPQGRCGMELSELLPHTGRIADELTLIRSMKTTSVDHESALRLIHTGKFQAGYPTWGSWVIYGLGSPNRNLPAYVVLTDPGGMPVDGVRNWASGWLPATYQGVAFRPGRVPVPNLATPADVPAGARRRQLELLNAWNRDHARSYADNAELEARITSFEVAARMQSAVPEALDLSREPEYIRRLYGLDHPATAEYGTRCLLARRLVERGVRFVQLFLAGQPWDTHSNNAASLRTLCQRIDRPSAALVFDLKQRGLLDRTAVVWGGEFGRLPVSQGKDGRDHNRHAGSLWIAGGGFRRGYVHGRTDEFGYAAVEDVVTVSDLHATLLHALGLDHLRLTFPHEGRPGSLTDVAITRASVQRKLLA
ncbi:MAG: DUF1501 domain-containing protein [Armatimonadetes bacterium]|nr:DUF1501 domain-containing protein [Armatimonadota bacterium]